MVFKKKRSRIKLVGASMLALLFFTACKKLDSKDPITFNITAIIPYDGTPIPELNTVLRVQGQKNAGQLWPGEEPTGWEINGVTDSQGKASGSFMGVLKTN